MDNKKTYGQFYTKKGMWLKPHIKDFILSAKATSAIDPFAGGGDLLDVIHEIGFEKVIGYDIDPINNWTINDSLIDIPYFEDTIVVTNPPYFGKSSAKRNRATISSYFEDSIYVDIYQIAIDRVLDKYNYAVFIIPETYLLSPFFKEHVESITVIEESLFDDTDCPVCIVCFNKTKLNQDYLIYKGDTLLFSNNYVETVIDNLNTDTKLSMRFNDLQGQIGLRGIDGTSPNDRIRFCWPDELGYDLNKISSKSRAITTISIDTIVDKQFLITANEVLNDFRNETKDVLLSPFKNNNKKGERRRRLDYKLARAILNKTNDILN